MLHLIRVFACFLFLVDVAYSKVDVDLGLGAGAVEQGDFLLQPSLRLGAEFDDSYLVIWDFYGRDYDSIEERTHMLSFAYRPQMTTMANGFSLLFGLSFLDEYTSYKPDVSGERVFNSTNFGFYTGIHWDWNFTEKLKLTVAWDAALFPAGVASIYLVTSRKQFITAGLGVKL